MLLENIDCLTYILSYLPIRERERLRLVDHLWRISADELARTQGSLIISGQRSSSSTTHNVGGAINNRRRYSFSFSDGFPYSLTSSYGTSGNDNNMVIHWPYNFIRYQCYCLILNRFPNLRSLCFEGIDHWNDHLIYELTTYCPSLQNIAFVRCPGLGRSRMNENDYMNVTLNGWNCLIQSYGNQITKLTLQDCDLDDHQLQIIVDGFRQLKYLDISSNRIVEATALSQVCPEIEVLKVGARLIGNNVSSDIPIRQILDGPGRFVSELCLQGFLSSNISLVSRMPNLCKLVIRFMKPLFDDINISSCLAEIGNIRTLRCLEIYQYNTHDCYMALSKEHLLNIFNGCNLLERFVLNCDIWCDSPLDDYTIGQMRRLCPRLAQLDLCPGNFQTTDQCLQLLSTFPMLKCLKIAEFSGITENGLLNLIRKTTTLSELIVEDCCDINTATFINSIKCLYYENPERILNVVVTPLRSLQIPTEVVQIPSSNPRYKITIFGQKDHRGKLAGFMSGYGTGKTLSQHCGNAYGSISSLLSMLMDSSISMFTFISTLLTFSAACSIYLFHAMLISISSRFTPTNHSGQSGSIFTTPFPLLMSTSFGALLLLGTFAVPTLYLISHLVYMLNLESHNFLSNQLFQLYDDSTG